MISEPIFSAIKSSDPEYQATIVYARSSLKEFRDHCHLDDTGSVCYVKKAVRQGEHHAFLWFSDVQLVGKDFEAYVFEVPIEFDSLQVGRRALIREDEVLDWMVNDAGRLHGGFSLRYQRARLPAEKQAWFDQQIGVTEYV